jgi:pSer/pThr/pTyr-binding forkhead associated (FHA) protein
MDTQACFQPWHRNACEFWPVFDFTSRNDNTAMKQLSMEAFLDACGGRGPLRLDVTAPDGPGPERQVLNQPFALLGRHERADVCLQNAGVSRRHALVQMIAGRVFCLDLGSRTGTHWDGEGQGHGWLPEQAPFRVGPYRLSLAGETPDSTPLALDGWNPFARGSIAKRALPAVTLNILNNGTTVCRWRMNRVVALVGNAEICKVRLRGPGVSSFHCGLICTPAGVWVIDLKRQGGVHVNRTPVMHSLLEDGDRLQVGNYTICVAYASAGAPAASASGADGAALLSGQAALPTQSSLLAGGLAAMHSLGPWPAPMVAPPPAAGNAGALLGETGNAELLASMMRQFSQMQHQMFDQSLVMLFQMFRTMHGEQTSVLREELARLDALNRELHYLLAEQLKFASPQAATPTTASPRALPPAADNPKAAAASTRDTSRVPGDPATPPSGHDKAVPPSATAPPGGEDVHVWLCQRMEAIKQERQGLWERVVGAFRKTN